MRQEIVSDVRHEPVQSPAMERYRIHPEAAVYYVTYSIPRWLPLFVTETTVRL